MIFNVFLLLFTILVIGTTVWGPEALARYQDRLILGQPHLEEVETMGAGYRYTLNSNERLFIVAQGLSGQILPESEQSAMTRAEMPVDAQYRATGNYAFVVNHRGPSDQEITDAEIYATCNRQLEIFKEEGILPASVREVEESAYGAVLYSAIDVLEPRNNVAVWKLHLTNMQTNSNKANRLLEVYLDGDNGKIYEFYARTELGWEDIDPDAIVTKWSEYMGLGAPRVYETDNPLQETTPFFKQYVFDGIGEERTVVTVGFYEGINELFLKIV
jgi:hypothetical protein